MKAHRWLHALMAVVMLVGTIALPMASRPAAASQADGLDKVEPLVLEQIGTDGQTDFFVWLAEKADLSPAYQLRTKAEKGRFVFETLVATAERTQGKLRHALDEAGVTYEAFYIANKILVRAGSQTLLNEIAARPEVAQITANHKFQLQEPFKDLNAANAPAGIETNVTFIKAPQAWALGFTGQGTVMAGNDTGLDWDHPAIINKYRGWNGTTADHNYNWWDATGTYPAVPDDGHGHGTHTTGTMVGDDGGANQIGVAPGAQTVHCKNMTNSGSGDDSTFTTCFQWDLAPWDLNHQNPDPSKAPDAINNSWGYWGGGQNQFRDEIQALHAAGVVVEVSAGNEGSGCGSLRSPGDYWEVLTTGSVNHVNAYPGTMTGFSSRGPSSLDPSPTYYFPDITAPGENIRSSVPGGGYQGGWSGTSMSGPHATALVGLIWSACPSLQGMVYETLDIIRQTATPVTSYVGSCGGNYTTGPNNDWGYGTIDSLAAVEAALAQCGPTGTLEGTVTDATTGNPIAGATVTAAPAAEGNGIQAVTDPNGFYSMILLPGTYNVTASKADYYSETANGVVIVADQTTTRNFALQALPPPVYLFCDDMEAGSGNWTHNAAQGTDDWAIVTTSSHSPTHAWYTADVSTVSDKRLWNTAPVAIPGDAESATLAFWHRHGFESGYDGSVIEISTDGGATWTDLGSKITQGGYNSTLSSSYSNPLGGRQAWSGTADWNQVKVDLSAYKGMSVQVRFRIGTDSSVAGTGWWIDDVCFSTPGASLTMHVASVALTKAGTGPWRLTGKGQIHDGAHALLAGVLVTGQWMDPSGVKTYRQFTTGAQGGYQFISNVSAAGQYRFCVVQLAKTGYTYVKTDNHPNPPCRVISTP
jgi:hypothetical protein